jgi:hypothetical protein
MADQAEKLKDEAEGFNCWVSFAYKAECHISRHERLEILLFVCSSLFFQKTSSCEKHVDKLQREQLNSQLWRHNAPL